MTEKTLPSTAPVLRLSADVWTLVSPFFGEGDVIRLISTGNTAFTERIRLGAHELKLSWCIARYMDLNEVFSATRRLHTARSLSFCQGDPNTLYWLPINWGALPSTLRGLDLSFPRAMLILRTRGYIASLCPGLESLSLSSDRTRADAVDLRDLPPRLTKLSLNCEEAGFVLDHLLELPSDLETLKLHFDPLAHSCAEFEEIINPSPVTDDMTASGDGDDESDEDGAETYDGAENGAANNDDSLDALHDSKLLLPALPESVTSLTLYSNYRSWHLDCATLPKSLVMLNLWCVDRGCVGRAGSSRHSSIDFRAAAQCLPHLRHIRAPSIEITVKQIIEQIPPYVVSMDFKIDDSLATQDQIEAGIPELISRLYDLSCGESYHMDKIVLSGKFPAPQLKYLNTRLLIGIKPVSIPPSVVQIDYHRDGITIMPPGLEILRVATDWSSPEEAPRYHFGYALKSLYVTYLCHMAAHQLEALPSTLESLYATFTEETWLLLMNLIRQPARLPNLRQLSSQIDLSVESLLELPSQVTDLKFNVTPTSALPSQAVLSSLAKSSLVRLDLEITKYIPFREPEVQAPPHMDATIAILNHLPQSLKTLFLTSHCVPSPHWPVTLPPKLQFLEMRMSTRSSVEHYHHEIDGAASSLIFLPPASLGHINLKGFNMPWKLEQLPPHLSVIAGATPALIDAYFASISPPAHLAGSRLSRMDN